MQGHVPWWRLTRGARQIRSCHCFSRNDAQFDKMGLHLCRDLNHDTCALPDRGNKGDTADAGADRLLARQLDGKKARDEKRDTQLKAAGYRVLRYRGITNIAWRSRGCPPGSQPSRRHLDVQRCTPSPRAEDYVARRESAGRRRENDPEEPRRSQGHRRATQEA